MISYYILSTEAKLRVLKRQVENRQIGGTKIRSMSSHPCGEAAYELKYPKAFNGGCHEKIPKEVTHSRLTSVP